MLAPAPLPTDLYIDVDNGVVTAVHESMSTLAFTTDGDAPTALAPRSYP
jgi:hypothetical protein